MSVDDVPLILTIDTSCSANILPENQYAKIKYLECSISTPNKSIPFRDIRNVVTYTTFKITLMPIK